MERLQPEHLERFYKKMQAAGSKPATAHQAHRVIRAALNEAMRRGHLARNVATLAKAPRITEEEVIPYSVTEVQALLAEPGSTATARAGPSPSPWACVRVRRWA